MNLFLIMSKTLKGLKGCTAVCAGLAVLAAGLVSCSHEPVPEREEVRRTLSFVLGEAPLTRASVTPHEDVVSSLDVLCFRSSDGCLENSNRVVSAAGQSLSGINVEVGEGKALDWFVVANAPAGALSYATEEAFLSGVTLLTHSTQTSLVMMGSGTLAQGAQSAPVEVGLDRYSCKVTVKEVVVDWPDAFTAYSSVTLGRVVLVNVVGSTPWSGQPADGGTWYNRMQPDYEAPSLVQDLTVRQFGIPVAQGVPVDVESPLYCMPNPVSNGVNSKNAPEWSPRSTRVAVELVLDGFPSWYPVDLPAMLCNRHYLIEKLVIKGPGSRGPDWPVERDDMQFTVVVQPWVDGYVEPVYQ